MPGQENDGDGQLNRSDVALKGRTGGLPPPLAPMQLDGAMLPRPPTWGRKRSSYALGMRLPSLSMFFLSGRDIKTSSVVLTASQNPEALRSARGVSTGYRASSGARGFAKASEMVLSRTGSASFEAVREGHRRGRHTQPGSAARLRLPPRGRVPLLRSGRARKGASTS
jgi:hypothetical protein